MNIFDIQKESMPQELVELNDYIDANLTSLKTTIDALPKEYKTDWNRLNELFLSIVG